MSLHFTSLHVIHATCATQVLRSVVDCLPVSPSVKRFVADFERGLWRAVQAVFANAEVRGCNFHWAQAVWRKVQECGLQVYLQVHKLAVMQYS